MEQETSFIWNPLLRQHLINAPHRMSRREGTNECPFCADIANGKVFWINLSRVETADIRRTGNEVTLTPRVVYRDCHVLSDLTLNAKVEKGKLRCAA